MRVAIIGAEGIGVPLGPSLALAGQDVHALSTRVIDLCSCVNTNHVKTLSKRLTPQGRLQKGRYSRVATPPAPRAPLRSIPPCRTRPPDHRHAVLERRFPWQGQALRFPDR
jgi:hypothetical protein